jgi:hypothetical protein
MADWVSGPWKTASDPGRSMVHKKNAGAYPDMRLREFKTEIFSLKRGGRKILRHYFSVSISG